MGRDLLMRSWECRTSLMHLTSLRESFSSSQSLAAELHTFTTLAHETTPIYMECILQARAHGKDTGVCVFLVHSSCVIHVEVAILTLLAIARCLYSKGVLMSIIVASSTYISDIPRAYEFAKHGRR